jgi:ISXO2-like transposase domain
MVESFFSRLRRAEIGTHHHQLTGPYLNVCAAEMAWRKDNTITDAALRHPASRQVEGGLAEKGGILKEDSN